jgi:transposase
MTALGTGADRRSQRTTQSVMGDLFGLALSVGTIASLEQATAQAMAAPVGEARVARQAQPAADVDETGGRAGRQRAWLWTAVTTWVMVFIVRAARRAHVAQKLWGERFWG